MPEANAPEHRKNQALIRAGVDYAAPFAYLVAFLITRDVVKATGVLVAASAVALAIGFAVERRIAPIPLLAGGAALVFGGLTLFFDDPRFIKVKPTVINIGFAAALFGGLVLKRNPLKAMLGAAVRLSDGDWRSLTVRYGVFFLIVAAANEAVWRTQSDTVWSFWRFPGLQLLSLAFTLTQLPVLMRGLKEVPPGSDG